MASPPPNREDVTAYYRQGAACLARGDAAGAVAALRRATELTPGYAWAHQNLGQAYRALGNVQAALEAYRRAIALEPNYVAALVNLGSLLGEGGRYAEGLELLKRAFDLAPDEPVVRENYAIALRARAAVLFGAAEYSDAARHASRALDVAKPDPDTLVLLGDSFRAMLQREAAVRAYEQANELRPNSPKILSSLATALRNAGRFKAAVETAKRAIAADPSRADGHAVLGTIFHEMGRIDEAVECCRRAVDLDPASPILHSALLWTLCFKHDADPAVILAEHRRFDEKFCLHLGATAPHENSREIGRRLRIGWVSSDFRRHPTGHFVLPAIRHHDRDAFEVFCYSATPTADDVTAEFRSAATQWVDIRGLSYEAVARRIRADDIDILVDCGGHMANSLLLVFARKPAPVQVSVPIYPSTTGLSAMDYRIVDPYFAPPGSEAWNAERLVRLPETHLCYEPRDRSISPSAELPASRNGHVTFASFNNPAKISEPTFVAWAQILRHLPDAKLILKWLGMPEFGPEYMLARFVRHGADPRQLVFAGWSQHAYRSFHDVDICLDPLHYNGGTTSCDSLWMGVPVVTRCGDMPVARYGLCFLTNIGLPELIAFDDESYVRIAVDLARDRGRLAGLRNGLRERFAASPLMDGARYTRHVEAAFREMWQDWCLERP